MTPATGWRDALGGLPPPSDPDSETALLAAVILDPTNMGKVVDLVSADDFGDPDFGAMFEGLRTLHDAGLPIGDPKVFLPELQRANVPVDAALVYRLIQEGTPANARYYAKQIRRCEMLRRHYRIGWDLLERTTATDADPADIGQWLESRLATIGQRVADPPRQLDEVAGEIIADLRDRDSAAPRGIMTGLIRHDETTGGWQPGELVILAARPGVGKTALALQVAMHNAMRHRPVLFVSLEMRDRELVTRVLCGRSRVDSRLLRAGDVTPSDLQDLERASTEVDGVPLRIWAPPTATLPLIRAVAKRERVASGLALLAVDYIGLVQPDDRTRPRHEQVAAVSAGLKRLAKELVVPVLALCQLNREADRTEPRLAHLRESGAIEQDADLITFLHRPDSDARTTLIVAKHRHGETGKMELAWLPEETRFDDGGGATAWTG